MARVGVGQAAARHLLDWVYLVHNWGSWWHQPDQQLQVLLFQKDPVCYIKKAFFLVQDLMEETISFKDNTSNAIALVKLLELSVRLNDCFPKVYDEHDKVGPGPGVLGQGRAHSVSRSFLHPTSLC